MARGIPRRGLSNCCPILVCLPESCSSVSALFHPHISSNPLPRSTTDSPASRALTLYTRRLGRFPHLSRFAISPARRPIHSHTLSIPFLRATRREQHRCSESNVRDTQLPFFVFHHFDQSSPTDRLLVSALAFCQREGQTRIRAQANKRLLASRDSHVFDASTPVNSGRPLRRRTGRPPAPARSGGVPRKKEAHRDTTPGDRGGRRKSAGNPDPPIVGCPSRSQRYIDDTLPNQSHRRPAPKSRVRGIAVALALAATNATLPSGTNREALTRQHLISHLVSPLPPSRSGAHVKDQQNLPLPSSSSRRWTAAEFPLSKKRPRCFAP